MKYDLIVIGGGIGGASVAYSLAAAGVRVLVLERETVFRDRVRGDMVYPWGVADARRLGLMDGVLDRVGHPIPTWRTTVKPLPGNDRDVASASPSGETVIAFPHQRLQEVLLAAAEAVGAEVWRGATAVGLEPAEQDGGPVVVSVRRTRAGTERVNGRLVVGADGRGSAVRHWAGFDVSADAPRLVLAGAVLDGVAAPEDVANVFFAPSTGLLAIVFPLGDGRHRVYGGYELSGGRRTLSGPSALPSFLDLVVASGTPAEWFDKVVLDGPLAAFDGADRWVDHPQRAGVVLVGDAAAASDPSFGCGVALTLRDARVLSEALVAESDWSAACRTYAEEHDHTYAALHTIIDWLTRMYRETGPDADARRRKAFPLFAADSSRIPDVLGLGPESPTDDAARRRFFGEE